MRHKNEIELQAERRVANAAFGFLSLCLCLFKGVIRRQFIAT